MMSDLTDLIVENDRLLHAMQAGVGYVMANSLSPDTEPKHLRVGVNNALLINSTIVSLLIQKGIFTEEEFYEAYNAKAKDEVEAYELTLSEHLKTRVTLG